MAHTLHLVSHTHWDREWYLTFQQFRMRLVDLIDHLLELLDRDSDFYSFHLDAQTIVLEDYLEIKPHNRQHIEQYIRAGRIVVGPWYQLNDEFLTSGEATIRSLLLGNRIATAFGACASIGYLPDQFGNLSQMPQIFRGFGIDNAVLGRGYQLVDDRTMEFIWESPDGSQVTASLMAFWYNNAQYIPADPDEALHYLKTLRGKMSKHSAVTQLLLMNGVDHLEAQQDLAPILKSVSPRLSDGDRVVHSTIEEYIKALKKEVELRGITLEKHRGELREDRGGSCLAGTLSTRMYIKQANHQAQITLEKAAEPFASFAMQAGSPYPQEFLQYAWKLLMKNHPHDSICGCSVDQVHREMMPRFAQVEQMGEELVERALTSIADQVDFLPEASSASEKDGETGLVVFNALNWPRTDPVRTVVVFPLGLPARGNPLRDDSRQVAGIKIFDAQGAEIPFVVEAASIKMRAVLSPVELPLDQWVQQFTIAFIAQDVPACGYKAYRVVPCPAMPQYEVWQEESGPRWQPVFEDVGDVGDEYLYRKPDADRRLEHPVLQAGQRAVQTPVYQVSVHAFDWDLPSAAEGTASRVGDQVACPVTTQVRRWRGIPRLEFETHLTNYARDHRVRVLFQNPAIFHPEPYSIAEGQFDVLYRPLVHPLEAEGASPFHPQQNWVALSGKEEGSEALRTVAVINQGMPEYEVYPNPVSPALAVTLLRSVNYLSRRGDGPQIETPEAQCLGEQTFRYALLETEGSWVDGKVWKQAYQFNVPLRVVQTGGQTGAGQRSLPSSLSFVTVEPDGLVVTAIKRAEDTPGVLIVRFFNILDEPIAGGRVWVRGAVSAQITNLNEEPRESLELQPDSGILLRSVGAKAIVTLAFHIA